MKKITLFLSVLLMAMVVKAQTEATATLVHTASSYSKEPAGTYFSKVDAEKEHINNSGFSGTWFGAAYAEFLLTIPEGHSVTSASLAWTGIGSGKNRETTVQCVNAGQTLNYETMAAGSEGVSLAATDITKVSFPANATVDFVTDVTDAVKTIIESEQSYVIFKFTGNVGGGDLVGKGAAEKVPVLTIETVDASAMTTYTVKYVDENGNKIAEDAVYDIAKGETASIADENKAAIWNADKTMKYIYKSCDKESITTVADGASNVITATFREAAECTYYVVALDAQENELKEFAYDTNLEGESVIVPYNQYIFNGGLLYETPANTAAKDYYRKHITLDEGWNEGLVTYSASTLENVVYFSEAEDIAGLTPTTRTDANIHIRCSNAAGAYNASETPVEVLTLTPGTYTITAQIWGNKGTDLIVNCGSESLVVTTTGSLVKGSKEFTVTENTSVTIPTCGWSNKCLDWIIIQSSTPNNLLAVVDGQKFTAATGTYAAATYTRKVNPAYNYGTICLPFVPNAATLENYTFYKLSGTTAKTVTFEEVTTPEAGIPYLYSAKDRDATVHTFIGGETTIGDMDFEPSRVALDDDSWAMESMYQEYSTAVGGGWMNAAYYAYKPNAEGEDVLVKATGTLTVKPYRAYFVGTAAAPLATMRIVVRGAGDNGDGTTGIEEVITPDQIEGAAPAIYNLMGQPVAQPVKGQIYIINGKKVVY